MPSDCQACAEPLVWALSTSGKRSPIEAKTSDDGNVLLLRPTALGGKVLAVVLSGDLLAGAQRDGVQLHLNHFAACPQREKFRT